MPANRRFNLPPLPSRPGTVLLAVLLLTLVLSGVLAYQTQLAGRSHERAAEGALRDYAGFASWELHRELSGRLEPSIIRALMDARIAAGGGPAPEERDFAGLVRFAVTARDKLGWCGCADAAHDFFVADLRADTVGVVEARLLSDSADWLVRTVEEDLRRTEPRGERGRIMVRSSDGRVVVEQVLEGPSAFVVAGVPGHPGYALVYIAAHRADRAPPEAWGFFVDVAAYFQAVVEEVIEESVLLPPSLTAGLDEESPLSIQVRDERGTLLYASPGEGHLPATSVADTLSGGLGRIHTMVSINPDLAGKLIIGGLPRSRLPLLVVVFCLTLLLVAVAVAQIRRQEELHRLRTDFVSGVSHELRTPLAQVRLFSELLDDNRLGRTQKERAIHIIRDEARRLTFLVENILNFARSERGDEQVVLEPVEVREFLTEIAEAFAPLARSRGVRIEMDAPSGLEADFDRDAMRQVLLNLLDNAVKYGPRDQVVELTARRGKGGLEFLVDDQGPGIPLSERGSVWEPYRRLLRDQTSAKGGSGIGLAIVRRLVELHGGRTWVGDAPAGGARFGVAIPLESERSGPLTSSQPVQAAASSRNAG